MNILIKGDNNNSNLLLNSENSNFEFGDSNDSNTSEQPEYDPLEQDWKIITEYYPNSRQHLESLSNINWKVSCFNKLYL